MARAPQTPLWKLAKLPPVLLAVTERYAPSHRVNMLIAPPPPPPPPPPPHSPLPPPLPKSWIRHCVIYTISSNNVHFLPSQHFLHHDELLSNIMVLLIFIHFFFLIMHITPRFTFNGFHSHHFCAMMWPGKGS